MRFIPQSLITLVTVTFALAAPAFAERTYIAWGRIYDTTVQNVTQRGVATATDAAGNAFITGTIDRGTDDAIYTAKYEARTGALLWQATFDQPATQNSSGEDQPADIATDSQGNVIVTGFSTATNSRDFYTIKYNGQTGVVIWEKRYNNPQSGEDRAIAVAVDASDNVIVTGPSVGDATNFDFHTIKYSAAAGNVLWERRFSTPIADVPSGLALDSNGNVAVAGVSRNTGADTSLSFYTAKYNGATGAVIWDEAFNGAAGLDDGAFGVDQDSAGNVVVVGTERITGGNRRFRTIKYAAANGATLWTQFYDSPVGSFTDPTGVAVDPNDNVIICGTNTLDNFRDTFYTAKYNGINGGLLWEKRSPGADQNDDVVRAFALDAAGNVIVTGSAQDTGQTLDYYTTKYRASDGATLWEEFLNGGQVAGNDEAFGIAVDANGDVIVTGTARKPMPSANFEIITVKYSRHLLSIGDLVRGLNLTDVATVSALSQPAVGQEGAFTVRIGIRDGKKKFNAIFANNAPEGEFAVAIQGNPAVSAGANAKFSSFLDPVISPDGTRRAFIAKVSGVPSAEANCVFNESNQAVIQTGKQAPGLPAGVTVKSISAISRSNDRLVALITLKGAGITGANSTAIVGLTNANAPTTPLQTGAMVMIDGAQSTIKKLSIFTPSKTSPGHGRYHGSARLVATATLADKRVAFIGLDAAAASPLIATNGPATMVATEAVWKGFSLPTIAANGFQYAALATLKAGVGGVTSANDSVLVLSSTGATFDDFAREGGNAPDITGGTFTAFSDPVTNSFARVAYLGTFKGTGISSKTKTALFAGTAAAQVPVARLGFPATDILGSESTAVYSKFGFFALPSGIGSGPIFLATIKGPGINGKNNLGLWSADNTGATRQVFGTGFFLGEQQVSKFALFTPQRGSFSNSRSFDAGGSVIAHVTFSDKGQSLIRVPLQ